MQNIYRLAILSGSALAIWGAYQFGKPAKCHLHHQVTANEDEKNPVQGYLQRIWKSMNLLKYTFQESSRSKADPLMPPYVQSPYTLVLEIKDVHMQPNSKEKRDWRFKKLLGVDDFLQECAKYFKMVTICKNKGLLVIPTLDDLKPAGYIIYRLAIIDWDANLLEYSPDNTYNLTRWLGNGDKPQLHELFSFLKTLENAGIEGIRAALIHYRQFDDPAKEFRDNQLKLLEKKWEEQLESKPIFKKWTQKSCVMLNGAQKKLNKLKSFTWLPII